MNWDQQMSYGNGATGYQKPYKSNYQRGRRGFQGIKTEPQYSSGSQLHQPFTDASASVMMASRGQQQQGNHYGPPRQPYNQQYQRAYDQRDGNDDRRNPLEEHTAYF